MVCGTLGTLVLTATLLGSQQLHLDQRSSDTSAKTCEASPDGASNATLSLKNAAGKSLYESKVQVQRFQFHESTETGEYVGGVAPAKTTTFIVNYPVTPETSKATVAELKTLDGTFHKSTPLTVKPPAQSPKNKPLLLIGLK